MHKLCLAMVWLAAGCGVPKIATSGIDTNAQATAAVAEINALLTEMALAHGVRDKSSPISCDKGSGSVHRAKTAPTFEFGFSDCLKGNRKITGSLNWTLEVALGSTRTGTMTISGVVSYQSAKYAGTFVFKALDVVFSVGTSATATQNGSFTVGDKPFQIDNAAIAIGFKDVTPPMAVTVRVSGPDPRVALNAQQRSACVQSATARIKAELIAETQEATPCQLTAGADTFSGECPHIPASDEMTLTLRWYTSGATSGRQIVLAEAIGRAALAGSEDVVDVSFDPTAQASLAPKHKALAGETDAIKNALNCDRSGTNMCDSTATPPFVTVDSDSCSNLEELCMGTLDTSSTNQCNT